MGFLGLREIEAELEVSKSSGLRVYGARRVKPLQLPEGPSALLHLRSLQHQVWQVLCSISARLSVCVCASWVE